MKKVRKIKKVHKSRKPLTSVEKCSLLFAVVLAIYLVVILPIRLCVTGFSWHWFVFGLLAIVLPFGIINLRLRIITKDVYTDKQIINANIVTVKYILYFWLLDCLYMAIFNQWIVCIYILGTITLIKIFYDSATMFIAKAARSKIENISLIVDFIVGVALSIYLIYLIPDRLKDLQTIVTSIVAALYGGILTLLGVAITIRKGERDRIKDEKNKYIPYLNLVKFGDTEIPDIDSTVEIGDIRWLKHERPTEDVTLKYSYEFLKNIYVKNISNFCLILKGILINNRYAEFVNNQIIEANGKVKIPRKNLGYKTYEYPLKVKLIALDVLKNVYYFDLEIELLGGRAIPYEEGQNTYSLTEYKCVPKRISLPKILEDKKLFNEIGNP